MIDPRPGFRPDLEGLRAVAVVLVLLYHASVPGFDGGYVGVDVFFVLSGFLITGLLLRERTTTGTVSLTAFYARRLRRLLPAASLVLVVTVVASAILLPPLRLPDVGRDAASAALYVSNIRFALQATDYLAAEVAPSPVLHFWSLSVEEQFYLFWPAIVLLLARRSDRPVRAIGIGALAITITSFVLGVWLTGTNAPWAFFSLPTRAWELGLGALLAIGAGRLARLPDNVGAGMAWLGLALIGASGVVLSTATAFPGTAALLPTIGAALVIAGGFRQSSLAPGRWMSLGLPRFLGRISYSLYLWHWPVLVLAAAAVEGPLPWWARGALVLLAIVLAAATTRWLEDPIRHGRWIGTLPRRSLVVGATCSVLVAALSLGMGARAGMVLGVTATSDASADERALEQVIGSAIRTPTPSPASPGASAVPTVGPSAPAPSVVERPPTPGGPLPDGLRPSLAQARDDVPTPYSDGCHAPFEATTSDACEYGDPAGTRTIVTFGDSHALSWFPTVERLASEHGWRFLNLTKSACGPADLTYYNASLRRAYTECDTWRADTLERIAAERPDVVVVAGSRVFSAAGPDGQPVEDVAEERRRWAAGMDRTLAALAPLTHKVVLLGDTPRSEHDVPVCLSEHVDETLECATSLEQAMDPGWTGGEAAAAGRAGATFVDPSSWVCPSSPCPAVIGAFMVLRDEHHLTTPFASALAGRLWAAITERGVASD